MVMLSVKNRSGRWILLRILAVILVVLTACLIKTSFRSSCSNLEMKKAALVENDILRKLGWPEAITIFQKDLVALSVEMKKQEKKTHGIIVDITPFNAWADKAIETFGARAVFTQVFHDIEWYFPENWYRPYSKKKEKRCNWRKYLKLWLLHCSYVRRSIYSLLSCGPRTHHAPQPCAHHDLHRWHWM